VSEGLVLASGFKVAIAEYANTHGSYVSTDCAGSCNDEYGLDGPTAYKGNYVSTVSAQQSTAAINVKFGAAGAHDLIDGGILILTPSAADSGAISWTCRSAPVATGQPDITKYLPSSCTAP
jgi:hypothetical protein